MSALSLINVFNDYSALSSGNVQENHFVFSIVFQVKKRSCLKRFTFPKHGCNGTLLSLVHIYCCWKKQ